MTLLQILVFSAFALLVGWWTRARKGLLLVISVLAIYWLQPAMPIRNLDFWLPTTTLGLTAWVWAATRAGRENHVKNDTRASLVAGVIIIGLVGLVGLTRYLPLNAILTPTRPPEIGQVAIGVVLFALVTVSLVAFGLMQSAGRNAMLHGLVWGLLALFVLLKTEVLTQSVAAGLRSLSGQRSDLASALDIRWLGFSYVAFRLIHALRDRLAGRLPDIELDEFVIYVIFFPAFTAGPIDRLQRFVKDLSGLQGPSGTQTLTGLIRITWGIFKKFIVADTLALIALNAANADQVKTGGWMWVLLYAYAFRIFFDFSGYTDIAIGLGKLMGFNLPENFERPYLKSNITTFWNSWHITLAQWFRAYWFNPLTRSQRTGKWQPPMWVVILIGQVTTMLLIGLWHGLTWNFAAWGLWHALGLFVHNRWSEATKARFAGWVDHPRWQQIISILGVLITFHYVALGWVWFALPSIYLSWQVLGKLFGP